MLRLTAKELAEHAGVGVATIRRFELSDGVPAGSARSLSSLELAFARLGIEFIGTPDDGPGVRLRTPSKR
jgi:transcriptional regulator with XRE-family HTH domain